MAPAALNPLSCARCKTRKIRCSREEPVCSRCWVGGHDCAYNKRRPRRRVELASSASLAAGDASLLGTISGRLEQLEARFNALNERGDEDVDGRGDGHGNGDAASPGAEPRSRSSGFHTSHASHLATQLDSITTLIHSTPVATSSSEPRILAELTDAAAEYKRLRVSNARAFAMDPASIPPALAHAWIDRCMYSLKHEIYLSLVDKDLIQTMPQLLANPHVHVDAPLKLLYYGILYQGFLLSDDPALIKTRYAEMLYLHCLELLPLCAKEGKRTTVDFIGYLIMTTMTLENHDLALSWKLHSEACRLARLLNLHRIDDTSHSGSTEPEDPLLNSKRKGFWQLIQTDAWFQFAHGMPPTITANQDWKVDFPWLSANITPDHPDSMTAVFLATSRITLIGLEYIHLLHDTVVAQDEAARRAKFDQYFDQIEDIMREWHLNEWLQTSRETYLKWPIADLICCVHNGIILVERRISHREPRRINLSDVGSVCTPSKRAVRSAQLILETLLDFVGSSSNPEERLLSFECLALYPFLAVLTLCEHIAHLTKSPCIPLSDLPYSPISLATSPQTPISVTEQHSFSTGSNTAGPANAADDVDGLLHLLDRFQDVLFKLGQARNELVPLVKTLRSITMRFKGQQSV